MNIEHVHYGVVTYYSGIYGTTLYSRVKLVRTIPYGHEYGCLAASYLGPEQEQEQAASIGVSCVTHHAPNYTLMLMLPASANYTT